ncbi:MAG TPA: alpha/beta hydrolase [Anaerolineae bacterium]|nr:alpha/beta hydrolase [Anaerolineae bacterium]
MPFATINGLELYYEVTDFTRPWEGEPEVLVLLHGLHGHMDWWKYYQVAPLSQKYRVVTLDQRGHGRSFKPATGYSIEIMASDVAGLLTHLNVERAHIAGASMGGMVSLQFALAYPEMVRSLILVDSYPHTPQAIQQALDAWITQTDEMGYAKVMETFNDDYATALYSTGFWERCPEFPEFETQLVLKNLMPDLAFVGCCRAIQRFDILHRLGEIAAPALVVSSNEGMAYEEALRMHQLLPASELWAPEGVGHSVHVEIPERFNARVLQFLNDLGDRS